MKKKSSVGLLKLYSKSNVAKIKELQLKQAAQLEAQKKILGLVGKITFWNDYEC